MWEKRTLWELSTRVPLLIRVPWIKPSSSGRHTRALAELIDIFPTLTDLAGIPLPADDELPIDGVSLRPVLEEPQAGRVRVWSGGGSGGHMTSTRIRSKKRKGIPSHI